MPNENDRLAKEVYKRLQKATLLLFDIQSKAREGETLYPDSIYGTVKEIMDEFPYIQFADIQLPNGADIFENFRDEDQLNLLGE